MTGPHGSLPAASYARAEATTCPSARTRRPSSWARRDFPIPEIAAHERHFGDGCHVLALKFVAVGCADPEVSVHRPNGLARFHRQVAFEHLRVPVVGAQRRASVAEREMRFHLDSNGRFVRWLQIDDGLGIPDRRQQARSAAERTLAERYARGEISEEELRQRRDAIRTR